MKGQFFLIDYKKVRLILGVLLLCLLFFSKASIEARQAPIVVGRDTVIKEALEASRILESLQDGQKKLVENHQSLGEIADGLISVHNLLPRYKYLYNQYIAAQAIADYQGYLETVLAGGDIPAYLVAHPALVGVVEVAPNMTRDEYSEYLTYVPMFISLGVANPNISLKEEYNLFIQPVKVTPYALRTEIMIMNLKQEEVERSIKAGAVTLFNATQQIKEGVTIQRDLLHLTGEKRKSAKHRYTLGLISQYAYQIEVNNEKIASLELTSLERDWGIMKQRLNQLRGKPLSEAIVLEETVIKEIEPLEKVEVYVTKALENRLELKENTLRLQEKENERVQMAPYYEKTAYAYVAIENDKNQLVLEKRQLEQKIEIEIRTAYMAVNEKEEVLSLAREALKMSQHTLAEQKARQAVGQVSFMIIQGSEIDVLAKSQRLDQMYRAYIVAKEKLENASDIGPAYSGEGGNNGR